MGRVACRRLGPAIQGFYAHALHQCADVLAADLEAFLPQQIAQHSCTGKGQFQVQSIDAEHQYLVPCADRLGLVVDSAPTDT